MLVDILKDGNPIDASSNNKRQRTNETLTDLTNVEQYLQQTIQRKKMLLENMNVVLKRKMVLNHAIPLLMMKYKHNHDNSLITRYLFITSPKIFYNANSQS